MVQVECTDTHESECLKKSHVQAPLRIIIDGFVVCILSNHRHFSFRHEVFDALINLSYGTIQLTNFVYFNSCGISHFSILLLIFFLVFFALVAWMNSKGNLFWIDFILHITEHKCILALHGCIKSENTFLVLSATKDDLVVCVENEEIDKPITFLSSWCSVNEIGASDVNRIFWSILVERLLDRNKNKNNKI